MSEFPQNSSPDDKPRLVVVVPVILVCLGAIVFLFNSTPSVRKESSLPQTNGVSEAPAAMMRTKHEPLNQNKVPGSRTLSRPPSRLLPQRRAEPPQDTPSSASAVLQSHTAAASSRHCLVPAGGVSV